jgi:hypothetical protein
MKKILIVLGIIGITFSSCVEDQCEFEIIERDRFGRIINVYYVYDDCSYSPYYN